MEELKPCPFCGGKAKVMAREKKFFGWRGNGLKVKSYFAYCACNRCRARGNPVSTSPSSEEPITYTGKYRKWFLPYIDRAVEAWNRRADDGTNKMG